MEAVIQSLLDMFWRQYCTHRQAVLFHYQPIANLSGKLNSSKWNKSTYTLSFLNQSKLEL